MKLESILLGVLARHPSTGYDLKKYMDTHGRFLRSNTQMSQVYRALGKMESSGWVTHTVQRRAGATDAKTYRITDEGMTVFLDWLTGPYSPPTRFQDPDFGARLAFAGFMTREQLLRLIDTELTTRRAEVARYRFRDRREPVDARAPFDENLATLVGEWAHESGAQAIDAHLERLEMLRRVLLDAPEGAVAPDLLARLHDVR
ncbi:PadR family transcriptional regulator [Streptomyces sp. HC44]|uniref:PadR family transcriptional regulator n=1 Tax=Streptomyces scabichelini TaxID=2711217 RepID=A0A6G4VJM5_9ACTN|nr:PadR family transcriptional regulator [Streptomyces scabichelini]NGO14010.1 PadR family transcriptional regulator [Streptomyces scabichelini]